MMKKRHNKKKRMNSVAAILAGNWLHQHGVRLVSSARQSVSLKKLYQAIVAHPDCPPQMSLKAATTPWHCRDIIAFIGPSYPAAAPILQKVLTAEKTPKLPKRPKVTKKTPSSSVFYESDEWRAVRYKALRLHGGACQCCGRTPREHKIVLHVDHIKPRSKFPELALDINNLQVLCEDCNLGKSNIDQTDWRSTLSENDAKIINFNRIHGL